MACATIGLGYDDALLAAIAPGGRQPALAEDDAAGAFVASRRPAPTREVVQATSLTVPPTRAVGAWASLQSPACRRSRGGFAVDMGDFYVDEQRKLLLTIEVPAMTAIGLAQGCES